MGEKIPGKFNIALQVDPVHNGAEEVLAKGKDAFEEKKILNT